MQFRWDGVANALISVAQPATHSSSGDRIPQILHVLGDVTLLQLLCQCLSGLELSLQLRFCQSSLGISLALPNGQPRLPGMRYVLHLLASCQRLLMPHRLLTHKWGAQFELDDQYELEEEAKHPSILGSSPEPNESEGDAYYARQQNGAWSSPDARRLEEWDSDYGADDWHPIAEPHPPSPNEQEMSPAEYFYAMQRREHRRNNLPYFQPWDIDSD